MRSLPQSSRIDRPRLLSDGLGRRTTRFTDAAWEAGIAKAKASGEHLPDVLRRLLDGYLAGHSLQYRAISKLQLDGAPVVVEGLTGNNDDIRKLFPPARWTIEEYDVSPPRPVKRKST